MYVGSKRYHYTFLLMAIMNKIVLGQILDLLDICFGPEYKLVLGCQ